MSRDMMLLAVAAVVGLSYEIFPMIHLEVLRDFFQTSAVVFSTFDTSTALKKAQLVFGNLSNLFTFNFNYVFSVPVTDQLMGIVIAGVSGGHVDNRRKGHEVIQQRLRGDVPSWVS